jgi:hypothetical protein|eukprot:COSAG02_NODE_2374_length_9019_cov_784.726121_9_plen_106_part_00
MSHKDPISLLLLMGTTSHGIVYPTAGTKEGFHRAASRYGQALCLDPDDKLRVVLHSNHAECMIQLGRNLKGKVSAEKALAVDPTVRKPSAAQHANPTHGMQHRVC